MDRTGSLLVMSLHCYESISKEFSCVAWILGRGKACLRVVQWCIWKISRSWRGKNKNETTIGRRAASIL